MSNSPNRWHVAVLVMSVFGGSSAGATAQLSRDQCRDTDLVAMIGELVAARLPGPLYLAVGEGGIPATCESDDGDKCTCGPGKTCQATEHSCGCFVAENSSSESDGNRLVSMYEVKYDDVQQTAQVSATGPEISRVTLNLSLAGGVERTVPVGLTWPEGSLTLFVDPASSTLRFDRCRDCGDGDKAAETYAPMPWSVQGRGEVPDEVQRVVREMGKDLRSGYQPCVQAAKWCGKYVGRMVGPAILCGLSLGTDGRACNEANEGKCAWCECKGYDCRNC